MDRAICLWTRGTVSHAAVLLGGLVYEAVPGPGVHCVDAASYFARYSLSQYEIFAVPSADDAAATAFARAQLGKRYDWRAILGFPTLDRATRERAGYWMCSEFAFCVVAAAGVYLFAKDRANPAQIPPAMLPLSPLLVLAARAAAIA